jgi:hypothetical protein
MTTPAHTLQARLPLSLTMMTLMLAACGVRERRQSWIKHAAESDAKLLVEGALLIK